MSPAQRRLATFGAAAAVLALFLGGLFIHRWYGGVLLVLVAAILAGLTSITWELRPKGRTLRILIIAAVLVGGVVKLIAT